MRQVHLAPYYVKKYHSITSIWVTGQQFGFGPPTFKLSSSQVESFLRGPVDKYFCEDYTESIRSHLPSSCCAAFPFLQQCQPASRRVQLWRTQLKFLLALAMSFELVFAAALSKHTIRFSPFLLFLSLCLYFVLSKQNLGLFCLCLFGMFDGLFKFSFQIYSFSTISV